MNGQNRFEPIEQALLKPAGARFWKCALQINPFDYAKNFQGDKSVQSEDAYNRALCDACVTNKVEIVGIADHGSVERIDNLRAILEKVSICVFPGFEIASTEKIHMVCLFEPGTPITTLNRYLGNLDMTDSSDPVHPSNFSCLELGKKILDLGGIWYAAHMTGNNGLLKLDGPGDNYKHIWENEHIVLAGQIPGLKKDLPENYLKIIDNINVDYYRNRKIAVINARDVFLPEDISNASSTCHIKMTLPSIEALKQAFFDPESRIRLQAEIEHHPPSRIIAIAWEGNFLDGIRIHLGENLNALIGGRGTGKSTIIETIRYAFNKAPLGEEARKACLEILKSNMGSGTQVSLKIASQTRLGKEFIIRRRFGDPPEVFDDAGMLSQFSPNELMPGLQILGQNEIIEIARNTASQYELIKKFIPDSAALQKRIAEIRKKLSDNRMRLLKQLGELEEITAQLNRLPKLAEQVASYQQLELEKKLAAAGKIGRETQIVERIKTDLSTVNEAIEKLTSASALDLTYLSPQSIAELPNKKYFEQFREILEKLTADIAPIAQNLKSMFDQSKAQLNTVGKNWSEAKASIEREVEIAIGSLPDIAGKKGREIGDEYTRLLKEIETIRPLEAKKAITEKLVKDCEQERLELLSEWAEVHFERFRMSAKAAAELSDNELKGKLEISVLQCTRREALKNFLTGFEGIGEQGVRWVDEIDSLMIKTLVENIKAGKDKLLDEYKQYGMKTSVADRLAGMPRAKLLELQEIELDDTVFIELNIAHSTGKADYRQLDKLSTGQKCTAILHLLMLQSNEPLIVDQPEDNLDNAFIAERIVADLRDNKCRRQFLFATHNANIPVFGDAEWIGVLEAENRKATLLDEYVGSIDKPSVQEAVKQVLEGGKVAFETRKTKYGF